MWKTLAVCERRREKKMQLYQNVCAVDFVGGAAGKLPDKIAFYRSHNTIFVILDIDFV
jgi:hypothetical protein